MTSAVARNAALLIAECSENARDLVRRCPPRLQARNKKLVFELSSESGECTLVPKASIANPAPFEGDVRVTRWRAPHHDEMPATLGFDAGTVEMSFPASIFAYDIPTTSQDGKPVVPWYVNFADSNVFGFYGGGLYAQDEMQVTEHPILGSVRQMLENLDLSKNPKMKALTMETQPTPILVENVQRRVVVDTFPSAAAPGGLYGNAFASASFETIVQATHVLNPPTMSNIIAIAAQGYGFGEYALPVINFSFLTAYTGFAAAVASSWLRLGKPADRKSFKVVINTGNWGCGAFGGNPTMMALIQFAAAQAAGVDELIYSTVMPSPAVNRAREIWNELVPTLRDKPVGAWLGAFEKLRLRWGVSNGT